MIIDVLYTQGPPEQIQNVVKFSHTGTLYALRLADGTARQLSNVAAISITND